MFTTRKKICFIVATLLLLILAGILSFNMRTMVVIPESSNVFGQRSQDFSIAKKLCWDDVYSKAQGNDRFFLQLNTGVSYPANILQCYRALYEAEPKNPIYIAYYAVYLAAADIKDAESAFYKLIDEWKQLDPENGMPYFLKAYTLLRKTVVPEKVSAQQKSGKNTPPENYVVKDHALAELALLEYNAGLKKKFASAYTDLAIRKKLENANLKRDPLGEMQRLSIAASCIPIPLLGLEQDLTFRLSALAKESVKKGRVAEACQIAASGKNYILQRLEKESPALINVLVYHSLCNVWRDTARDIKHSDLLNLYDGVAKEFDTWRNRVRPDAEQLKKHGGLFAQTLLPTIKTDVATEDYRPERMINYLIIDQYGLIALYTQLAIIIGLLALITGVFYLFRRKAQWIQLPVKTYVLLAVAGVFLPLAIQLIWTHTDVLSGRDLNFSLNGTNLSWLAKYQVFISPVYFAILCCVLLVKKGGAKPLDCIWNLILPLSAYLFLTIAILRPIQDLEISYYTQQDKLIHSESGFTALEDQAIKELSGNLKMKLNGK